MIICACGHGVRNAVILAAHQPVCLGPAPTMEDLYRIGKVREMPSGCHEWRGATMGGGYGKLPRIAARQLGERSAHRAALALAKGQPLVLQALHSCDNPPCINVAHLREGTVIDNVRDALDRGRFRGGFKPGEPARDIGDYACPCGRTFRRPCHLGRHRSACTRTDTA